MRRRRGLQILANIPAFVVLLFGVGAGHALLTQSFMPSMGVEMAQSPCQASCANQFNSTKESDQKLITKDEDDEPQPPSPYYIAFIGAGWSLVIVLLSFVIRRHLRWRPPDINRLHSQYLY